MTENNLLKPMLLFSKAITPVHAGAGEGTLSLDLPVQREASTNFPKIDSSVMKGCLSRTYSGVYNNKLFGYSSNKAGLLSFTDMKLLFFPVTAVDSAFLLITCPFVLNRFASDANKLNLDKFKDISGIAAKCDEILQCDDDCCYFS